MAAGKANFSQEYTTILAEDAMISVATNRFKVVRGARPIQVLQLDDEIELSAVVNRSHTHASIVAAQHENRLIKHLPSAGHILRIKLRRDCIVLAFELCCLVYHLEMVKSTLLFVVELKVHLETELQTCHNPKGLLDVSTRSSEPVFVYLGQTTGTVVVQHGFGGSSKSIPIHAHQSHLAALTVSFDGMLVATVGAKGTLIRVFETLTGCKVREFRRGLETVDVNCMAFSACNSWLAVSSNNATVHVFSMGSERSMINTLTSCVMSVKSFAQLHLPKTDPCPTDVGFYKSQVLVLNAEGRCRRFWFDTKRGGEMSPQLMNNQVEAKDDNSEEETHSPTVQD